MSSNSELKPIGSKVEIPKNPDEFLALVNKGDKKAIAALEKARTEVMGGPDNKPVVETNPGDVPIIQGPIGTKSPEFKTQLNTDSGGQKYSKILDRALQIIQGSAEFSSNDEHDITESLMNLTENDKS